ncbi:MAG: Asp-tRNA(Asn)/Glu-tRNA(Gln) amidotransferase subunit GatC, partial [Oscillospiraceae bacterium]|nr:Asp-tRNA(Asn)/Glu-tRNA(Gln) amidotransferase subunit GatC [Oscillospiraceae bacterium]
IALTSEEITLLEQRGAALMSAFAGVDAADTSGVQPMVTPIAEENVMRRDEQSKTISREELLSGAPEQYNGYFQVPKTVGN